MTAQLIASESATGGSRSGGTRQGWVLAAASVASFMVALDLLVVTTSLDTIRRDLGTSTGSLQWIVTAYGVSFAALLLTGAALGDRFGRRRTMSIGLAVFALGSAGAALSPGVGLLIAARGLQGVGGAIVLPIGLTIVTSAFPPSRRGTAIGILEGVTGLAVIAGPVMGGAISHWLAWQWIFWINVPVALVAIFVVHVVVEETFGPDKTIDLAGLVLVSIAATATVLVARSGKHRWMGECRIDCRGGDRSRRGDGLCRVGAPGAGTDAAETSVSVSELPAWRRHRVLRGRVAVRRGVLHGPVSPG